jgi:prepilin-type N-terminal cleavage/methylation domain-containing protein
MIMNARSGQAAKGFTLVELLLALAVIAILAGLIASAAVKAKQQAKEKAWVIQAGQFMYDIRERLTAYYDGKTDYPAWTAAQLHQWGVLDDKDMDFLRAPQVTFRPFSSGDPEDMYVLEIRLRGRVDKPFGYKKVAITRPKDFPY